jgi:hypothetical protein
MAPDVVTLRSLRLHREDADRPAVSDVGGRLASAAAVWGVSELTHRATDVGGVARVTAAGKPVASAVVSVLERESGSRVWRATRSVTTSRLGGVSVKLAPGPSREVRFA